MAGPYTAKLVSATEGVGNENVVLRFKIFNGDGTLRLERDFPSNTVKPETFPFYMEEVIREIEEKDAGLVEFAKIDLSSPVDLTLPRDDPDSPVNAFFAKYAILRERLDEYAHGLRALDDSELLASRAEAIALLKPEYKKDPRWFR